MLRTCLTRAGLTSGTSRSASLRPPPRGAVVAQQDVREFVRLDVRPVPRRGARFVESMVGRRCAEPQPARDAGPEVKGCVKIAPPRRASTRASSRARSTGRGMSRSATTPPRRRSALPEETLHLGVLRAGRRLTRRRRWRSLHAGGTAAPAPESTGRRPRGSAQALGFVAPRICRPGLRARGAPDEAGDRPAAGGVHAQDRAELGAGDARVPD
jgi:hypothetical protein